MPAHTQACLQLALMVLATPLALSSASFHRTGRLHTSSKHTSSKHTTFAVIGDWGGVGGMGDPGRTKLPIPWAPGPSSCPPTADTPFFNPPRGVSGRNYTVHPCVLTLCGRYDDGSDELANCIRTIQQLAAPHLYNKVCKKRGCQAIINTSDNFYMEGCNSTSGPWGGSCQERFRYTWNAVYQNDNVPALKELMWYGSLGNHDLQGDIDGIEQQIAYTKQDKKWFLPARWYNTTIGKGTSAVHLVVSHSSCLVDAYLEPTHEYSSNPEVQACSTPAKRQEQLDFLEAAMKDAAQKPGWLMLVSHHPPIGGGSTCYISDGVSQPESAAWAKVQGLIQTYKPAAVLSGHSHVVTYSSLKQYQTQFFVSGAGGFTSSGGGGYNATSDSARTDKPYLKYGSVSMKGGKTYTGFIVVDADDTSFQADMYISNTDAETQFTVSCSKKAMGGYTCSNKPGRAPNYVPSSDRHAAGRRGATIMMV